MARNILEDIKNDLGYYYVNEQYDLNDFVLLIAFVFLAVAMGVVEVIYQLLESLGFFNGGKIFTLDVFQ